MFENALLTSHESAVYNQEVFYTVGTVFMIVVLILLFGLIIGLLFAKRALKRKIRAAKSVPTKSLVFLKTFLKSLRD